MTSSSSSSSSCGVLCLPSSIIDSLFAVTRSRRVPPSHVLATISIQNEENSWVSASSCCYSCQLVARDFRNPNLMNSFIDTSVSLPFDTILTNDYQTAPSPTSFLSPSLSQSFIDLPFAIDAISANCQNVIGNRTILLETCKLVGKGENDGENATTMLEKASYQHVRIRVAVPLVLVQQQDSSSNNVLNSVTLSCMKKERIDEGKIVLSELGLINNLLICGGGQGSLIQLRGDAGNDEKRYQVMSLEGKNSNSCGIVGNETRIILNELPAFVKKNKVHDFHQDPNIGTNTKVAEFLDYDGSFRSVLFSMMETRKQLLHEPKQNQSFTTLDALLVTSPPGNGKSTFVKQLLSSESLAPSKSKCHIVQESDADNVFHIFKLLTSIINNNNNNNKRESDPDSENHFVVFESEAAEKFFLPRFADEANFDPEDDNSISVSSAATQLSSLLPTMSRRRTSSPRIISLIFILPSSKMSIIPNNFTRTFFIGSHHVSLDLPNEKQRELLMRFFLKENNHHRDEISKFVSENSIGYSVWDLKQISSRIDSSSAKTDDSSLNSILKTHLPLSRQSTNNNNNNKNYNNNNNQSGIQSATLSTKILWSDVAGLEKVKESIARSIIWPIHNPRRAKRFGITRLNGIMLHGPPGCAKTTIAKAICSEGKFGAFFHMDCASVLSAFVGEAEKTIRDVFHQARVQAPSVIFFDEIESFGGKRKAGGSGGSSDVSVRLLATLLTEMDGINGTSGSKSFQENGEENLDDPASFGVCVIGATNLLHLCDEALLRPGRFDLLLEVPLPSGDDREKLFTHCLKKSNNHREGNDNKDGSDIRISADVKYLAAMSQGCSGAEITGGWRDGVVTKLMNLNRNILLNEVRQENEQGEDQDLDVTQEVAACIRKNSGTVKKKQK